MSRSLRTQLSLILVVYLLLVSGGLLGHNITVAQLFPPMPTSAFTKPIKIEPVASAACIDCHTDAALMDRMAPPQEATDAGGG